MLQCEILDNHRVFEIIFCDRSTSEIQQLFAIDQVRYVVYLDAESLANCSVVSIISVQFTIPCLDRTNEWLCAA
jgi:hypothetical protein